MLEVEDPLKLTPQEFEIAIKELIQRAGLGLSEFSATHLEKLPGVDGDYTIDVTARFQALGVNFLVLIECKRYKNPVERAIVQALNDKLRSTGAQKAMLFSSSRFQSGAIEYAATHGIALIQLVEGELTYHTKAADGVRHKPPPWADIPKYVGWLLTTSDGKAITYTSFSEYAKEMLPEIYGPR